MVAGLRVVPLCCTYISYHVATPCQLDHNVWHDASMIRYAAFRCKFPFPHNDFILLCSQAKRESSCIFTHETCQFTWACNENENDFPYLPLSLHLLLKTLLKCSLWHDWGCDLVSILWAKAHPVLLLTLLFTANYQNALHIIKRIFYASPAFQV